MTGVLIALIVGSAIEILGLAVAAYGFRKTWAEHGAGERFLEPLHRGSSSIVKSVRSFVLRLHGRRQIVVGVGAAMAGAMAGSATARVGFGPLPAMNEDPVAFERAVEARLARVFEQIQITEEQLTKQIATEVGRADAERHAQDVRIAEIAETTKKVAVGGLRLQVTGWSLVLIGFVIQTVAQVFNDLGF